MEIRVKILTNKKKEEIVKLKDGRYQISVDADRRQGKANERMIKLIANFFETSEDNIVIKSGHTSSTKVIGVRPL